MNDIIIKIGTGPIAQVAILGRPKCTTEHKTLLPLVMPLWNGGPSFKTRILGVPLSTVSAVAVKRCITRHCWPIYPLQTIVLQDPNAYN